jgi:RNA polymerase sigma factor (sigma-70 family)
VSGFRDTRWSLLDGARQGDTACRDDLVRLYRPPVVRFLRSLGAGQDAEDLAQEVFLRLFEDVLGGTDRAAGRFRSLLLAVSRNVYRGARTKAQAKKRGGGVAALSLREDLIPAEERAAFDREWVLALIERAVADLAAENPAQHAAMSLHLGGASHDAIAAELGCSTKDVRNRLHRARKALARLLRAAAWNHCADPAEHATELALLREYLPGQRS